MATFPSQNKRKSYYLKHRKQHIGTIIAGKVNVLFVLLQLKYLRVQNREPE
jgi:hypothetical protein